MQKLPAADALFDSAVHAFAHAHAHRNLHEVPIGDAPPPADLATASETTTLGGASPTVAGRYVFYAGTPLFGDVWASDKSALLPGQTASFSNITAYAAGIDEVVLDVSNAATSYSASDFVFRTGQSGDPSTWAAAPAPAFISVAAGAGTGGSSRVTIKWADGSISNKWLQVNFTPAADTFYFGNLVGDTGDFQVNSGDELTVRANPTTLLAPATVTNPCDFNRDGKIDAFDQLIARGAVGNSLNVLAAPAPAASYDWHTATINGALNIWAPNPGDFGSTFTVSDPNALFGSDGVPQLEGVHQGPTADCYFLSAGGALAYSTPSRIQSLVTNDTTGGWAVTFQYYNSTTGKYVPVVIHTSKELSSSLQTVSNGEVWSLAIEKAYAAFRTWNGTTSQNTMASLGWGYGGTALLALNDANSAWTYTGNTAQTIYNTLQTSIAAHKPILFHTSSTASTMIQSHVYVIVGVSTDASGTKWVNTYNPWGFYDQRTEADLLANGVGTFVIGTA